MMHMVSPAPRIDAETPGISRHNSNHHWEIFGSFIYNIVKSANYCDVIMRPMASQITSVWIVYSTIRSDANQRKHLSPASLAFVRGIHWWPVNSPHKGPVTRKTFPFDDVIIAIRQRSWRFSKTPVYIYILYIHRHINTHIFLYV